MSLSEIQQQVGRGEYRIDAQAVADAILQRIMQQLRPDTALNGERGHE